MSEITVLEWLKIVLIGIIEGITEWLPVSSTGHMLIFDRFFPLEATQDFKNVFFVVIQLGAIFAVVTVFFAKMMPFGIASSRTLKGEKGSLEIETVAPVIAQNGEKGKKLYFKKDTFMLWVKIALACLPSAVIGLFFDDILERTFGSPYIISAMLILYGAAFIIIEKLRKHSTPKLDNLENITFAQAFIIGAFQVLSLIPGTSRSGATIIGALLIGIARPVAAEFTFFLAVPTMLGASALKLFKYGFDFTPAELLAILCGMAVAYAVSVVAVKFLMQFVKKHSFTVFGFYRIALGAVVIAVSLI